MKTLYKFTLKKGDTSTDYSFNETTKALARENEMLYARIYAEGVRGGLLTNAEAVKLTNERGGVFSQDEKEDYVKSLGDFLTKEKEATDKRALNEDVTALEAEISELKDKVLFYQGKQDAVFEFTAESRARDAVLLNNALALAYSGDKPVFGGKDYISRVKWLDENGDGKEEILKKAMWYSTAIFYGVKDIEKKFPEENAIPETTNSTTPDNNVK